VEEIQLNAHMCCAHLEFCQQAIELALTSGGAGPAGGRLLGSDRGRRRLLSLSLLDWRWLDAGRWVEEEFLHPQRSAQRQGRS
jgi:hypothetical protein